MSAKRDSGIYSPRDEVLLWLGAALASIYPRQAGDSYQHLAMEGGHISFTPGRTGIHADDHWHDWHDRLVYRDATTYQDVAEWLETTAASHAVHTTIINQERAMP